MTDENEAAVAWRDPIEQVKGLLLAEAVKRDTRNKLFEQLEDVLFKFGQADYRLSTERVRQNLSTMLSFNEPRRRGGNLVQILLESTQVMISKYGREYTEVTSFETGQAFVVEVVVEALTRANITDFPSTWVH